MYELFEHTADLGLRVRAPDLEALFAEAAEGLFAAIAERSGEPGHEVLRFDLHADRLEWLFFDWLAELLYVFESRRLLLGPFHVRLAGLRLTGEARGRPFDTDRDRSLHEVKAITYHGLSVEHGADGWVAEVVVDI
jgi:SHS2 domain-containing protein